MRTIRTPAHGLNKIMIMLMMLMLMMLLMMMMMMMAILRRTIRTPAPVLNKLPRRSFSSAGGENILRSMARMTKHDDDENDRNLMIMIMVVMVMVMVMMMMMMMVVIQDLWFCGGFGGGRIRNSEESQVQD